jgi:MFS family permease
MRPLPYRGLHLAARIRAIFVGSLKVSNPQPVSQMRAVSSLALLYMFRMMGLFMVFPVMTLYGMSYEDSTEWRLGFAVGIYGLSQAFCQIPLGLLSDIFGRKKIIFIGLLVMIIGSVIAALAESVWGLMLGRALQGIGAVGSAIMALVGDLTTEENRSKAMAVIGASIGVSFVLALIMGSSLAALGGLPLIFWVTAGLSVIGLLILWRAVPNPPDQTRGKDALAVPAMLGKALRDTELWRLYGGIFSLHFILSALFVALPVALQDAGFANQQHAYLYTPVLLLAFIGMMPLMHRAERKRQVKPIILLAIAALAAGAGSLRWVDNHWWHWALGLWVFFMAFCLLEALLPSLLSKQAPAGCKGTAMGVFSTCQFLGLSAGGFLGGYWLQQQSTLAVFGACSSLAFGWLALAVFMRKPVYLTSISLSLTAAPNTQALCAQVAGVQEAVWVEEQQLLHLKVTEALFDRQQLDSHLATHAAPLATAE